MGGADRVLRTCDYLVICSVLAQDAEKRVVPLLTGDPTVRLRFPNPKGALFTGPGEGYPTVVNLNQNQSESSSTSESGTETDRSTTTGTADNKDADADPAGVFESFGFGFHLLVEQPGIVEDDM